MDAVQPTHRKAPPTPAKTGPKARRAAPARPPAYLRAKLAVSRPGDPEEKAADQVAREVSATPRQTPGAPPRETKEMVSSAVVPSARRLALFRQPEEEQAQPLARLRRQPEEEEEVQTRLYRQSGEEEMPPAAQSPEAALDPELEQQIEARRGMGAPLPDEARAEMEAKFGRDFKPVEIHTDAQAAALCGRLEARAFTVGRDIFFAPGEFAPHTEAGRGLLAHELAHVAQQASGARRVHRSIDPADTPAGNAAAETRLRELSTLNLPPIKQRHLPLYTQLAESDALARIRNYTRTRTAQTTVWKQNVTIDETAVDSRLQALTPAVNLPNNNASPVTFRLANHSEALSFPKRSFLSDIIKVPKWDRAGNYVPEYQVDHIVELQTSGAHGSRSAVGNNIQNMELLDQPSNSSSGATIMNGVYTKVDNYLNELDPKPDTAEWLRGHDIIFNRVTLGAGGGHSEGASSWWTVSEIQALDHLNALRGAPSLTFNGDVRHFILASGPGGVEMGRFTHDRGETTFAPRGRSARSVAGLEITSINLTAEAELDHAGGETEIGTITANWDLPPDWQPTDPRTTMPIYGLGPYAGYLVPRGSLAAGFAHASPAVFNELQIGSEGITAQGAIARPSLPLLSNMEIGLALIGDDIVFRAEYQPDNLNLEFPGLTIYDGAIGLSYSKRQGFGVDGSIYLTVPNLGSGSLSAGFSQGDGFSAEGSFNFDTTLFDRATARLWYRNSRFGGEGTLGIDSPDKVRGIRSAEITVGFGEDAFHADGRVSPNIPGIQEAGLRISYAEEQGLTIGGNLELAANPAIRSGSIEVTLNKQGEAWKVSASGTAQPAIPGIDSQLTVGYQDGAFTAEFSGAYQRGMLSGTVTAGVTNRGVGQGGQLTESAAPDSPLIVYGGGSVTVQIAPWLQGTAGIAFAPNGEVTVTGEIGLPGALEIFPRREINRSIFNIAVQIPIVPGIVAEIGGGLGAVAGIGPGMLERLSLGITYNPAHEENTRITGDAHLRVPADAGLRLSVRAGIGLGITGASATGGLEIGGTLGIEGAAEAGVHVEWTPATGLDLRAEVAVSAQPSFTFDISGYVSVRALGFSVYDETWELASFRFGSDMRFGIRLPIHYHEGEPFDISLDDVQFEVPDIDAEQILSGLIDRIA